ncbi:MAG: TlpA family protein disulfide reductase [Gemmatimonadaceae bacterium]|nr:TlpA family protein disulfide reductase [Gemmatimonadaceae bacterium]MDQ3243732.1 TlpA family protein disulfide reductase [Gemmatimonadota bacterium]
MTGRRQLAAVVGVIAIVAAAIAGGRILLGDELAPIGLGARAPGFEAVTLDSAPRMKSLADYRGNVLMINIWATWCAPCRIEMPSIQQLHDSYGSRGLKVVAVSIDDPGTEPQVRAFASQYNLTFEILHDPKSDISRKYQTTGYPETVIVGRDGIIRKKLLGATDWNSPQNRALIERLLAEKSD